ncbi:MAG: thiol-disulfide isomerase [Planctomycetota bacterium]|nr:MAG: thiol-disulfide isomerase [Planctomycetota bacterium]
MGRFWQVALAAILACGATTFSWAAEAETPIGKKIENFTLPDHHGKPHALADVKDKLVVIAFVGTECPLAKNYAPRLKDLSEEFGKQGVAFLAINSNVQDSLSEVGNYARIHELPFPVLKDNNNVVADQMGAVRTPEVFLLDEDRVVRYWGRIDDQYGFKTGAGYVKPKLRNRFLADAITEVLAGKDVSEPVVEAHGCFIGRVAKKDPQGEITYSNQIARIMQNNCVECHREGEVAPFTLGTYDDVAAWAETIREVVDEGRMPPWFASPEFGHFANDARLSDEDKAQLYAWVDNGCPEGDPKNLPEPREFVEGWQIGEPDQVIYMDDEAFTVPAEGTVDYQYFTVDPGWDEDKWIQSTEARPDNRSVVHHIIVFVRPPGGGDFAARGGIGGYAPGMTPDVSPPGTAKFVPAGSKLVFQMHYTTNGTEQTDRSMVGVKFADPKTVKKQVRGGVVGNATFRIPPHDANHEVVAKHYFFKDTLLLDLTPHMHVRGKDFKYVAHYPDGTEEVLLDVPKYDFNWQLRYELAEPKLMPKGSRLVCTAHFDNSTDNLANPDPNETVTYGDQTWEEMMFGFYTSVDPKQDLTKELVEGSKEEADKEVSQTKTADTRASD